MKIVPAEKVNVSPSDLIRLDSAGIIYPYAMNEDWNAIFRVEAILDETIEPERLKQALTDMKPRFPGWFIQVCRYKGSFMLYQTDNTDGVVPETSPLCLPFDVGNPDKLAFRVTYSGKRIGLEVFHSLGDGHAGLVFLKTLIARYYILKGENIPASEEVLDCDAQPDPREMEDAFGLAKSKGGGIIASLRTPAYQFGARSVSVPMSITEINMSEAELYGASKKNGITVSKLLTSVYLFALLNSARANRSKREVRLSVTLDMRRFIETKTLRNFSLYIFVSMSPRRGYTLKDVFDSVSEQFSRQLDENKLAAIARSNYNSVHSVAFEKLPFAVKCGILKIGFDLFGEHLFTSAISNIGRLKLPDELAAHVEDINFIIGPTKINKVNVTTSSYNGNTKLVVSSRTDASALCNEILRLLTNCGVSAEILRR